MSLEFLMVCVVCMAFCIVGCFWSFVKYYTKGVVEIKDERFDSYTKLAKTGIKLLYPILVLAILFVLAVFVVILQHTF